MTSMGIWPARGHPHSHQNSPVFIPHLGDVLHLRRRGSNTHGGIAPVSGEFLITAATSDLMRN